MREIKFKTYWKDEPSGEISSDVTEIRISARSFSGSSQQSNFRDLIAFCQYSGLKDKNGTYIYEGDIIADSDLAYVVLYGDFQFEESDFVGFYVREVSLYCKALHSFGPGGPIGLIDQSVIDVIGNIHQNPELLNKYKSQC